MMKLYDIWDFLQHDLVEESKDIGGEPNKHTRA